MKNPNGLGTPREIMPKRRYIFPTILGQGVPSFPKNKLGKTCCTSYRSPRLMLGREAALFLPGHECKSPIAPSDYDRVIPGYRLYLDCRRWGTPTEYLVVDMEK